MPATIEIVMSDKDVEEDMTWRLHPSLQNSDVACIVFKSSSSWNDRYCSNRNESLLQPFHRCYFIEKGRFREIMDVDSLIHLTGTNLCSDNIHKLNNKSSSSVKFISSPLDIGDFPLGEDFNNLW